MPSEPDRHPPSHIFIVGLVSVIWFGYLVIGFVVEEYLGQSPQSAAYGVRVTSELLMDVSFWVNSFWTLSIWAGFIGAIYLLLRRSITHIFFQISVFLNILKLLAVSFDLHVIRDAGTFHVPFLFIIGSNIALFLYSRYLLRHDLLG